MVRTGLEKFDAAVSECVRTGATDVKICFDEAGDVLGELVSLRCQVQILKSALEKIAEFKGDPATPIHNSVKKSGIARAALTEIAGQQA